MVSSTPLAAALMAGTALFGATGARAGIPSTSTTLATWVQYAPGSTVANPTLANFGDAPLSATNTILVRAVVTDANACPVATYEDGTTVQMSKRFRGDDTFLPSGSQTAAPIFQNMPLSGTYNNVANAYPKDFYGSLASPANGTPAATSAWGECEMIAAGGHKTVTVSNTTMKLPVANPKRILVIADVGCRVNGAYTAPKAAAAGVPPDAGKNQQNCNNPAAFPFAYLANIEATMKPDAIMLIGDWFYRDTDCANSTAYSNANVPNGTVPTTYPAALGSLAGCSDRTNANFETWGDTFDSWMADVFVPAKTLLATAPWIMIRGNHESCGRGGRGWYAFLDARPFDANAVRCVNKPDSLTNFPSGQASATYNYEFTPTWLATLNGVTFLVHDSSIANDTYTTARLGLQQSYDYDLTAAYNAANANNPNGPVVFATHKPPLGLIATGNAVNASAKTGGCYQAANTFGTVVGGIASANGNGNEQVVFNGGVNSTSAFKTKVPDNLGLLLSGHVHQFQTINFNANGVWNAKLPPQMIVGTGGDLLDVDCTYGITPFGLAPTLAQKPVNATFQVNAINGGATALNANAVARDEFGFAVLDETFRNGKPSGYLASIYRASASKGGLCRISFADASTTPATPRRVACSIQ